MPPRRRGVKTRRGAKTVEYYVVVSRRAENAYREKHGGRLHKAAARRASFHEVGSLLQERLKAATKIYSGRGGDFESICEWVKRVEEGGEASAIVRFKAPRGKRAFDLTRFFAQDAVLAALAASQPEVADVINPADVVCSVAPRGERKRAWRVIWPVVTDKYSGEPTMLVPDHSEEHIRGTSESYYYVYGLLPRKVNSMIAIIAGVLRDGYKY